MNKSINTKDFIECTLIEQSLTEQVVLFLLKAAFLSY